eukprot:13709486-Ditylum_brightwellii.AAC.1
MGYHSSVGPKVCVGRSHTYNEYQGIGHSNCWEQRGEGFVSSGCLAHGNTCLGALCPAKLMQQCVEVRVFVVAKADPLECWAFVHKGINGAWDHVDVAIQEFRHYYMAFNHLLWHPGDS